MLIDSYRTLLENEGFLPLENNHNWNTVEVDHTQSFINKGCKVTDNTGIYIYMTTDGIVQYVGEGKINSRMNRHYLKLTKTTKGSTYPPRHEFFKQLQCKMNVFYRETPDMDKQDREAIEAMLTKVLQPEYKKWLLQRKAKPIIE